MVIMVEIISNNIQDLEGFNDANTFMDKKVVSKSGAKIGSVSNIIISNYAIKAIKIGKRVVIDKEFISEISDAAVMLSIDPITELVGKRVFDSEGRILGKVIKLVRNNNRNDYSELLIRKSIFRKPLVVPGSYVDVSERNIILKKAIK